MFYFVKRKKLTLRNIVATGMLYQEIDTLLLVGKFESVTRTDINSTRVIIRLVDLAKYGDEFKSTFTLFQSGKMNYMGAKSIEALIANTMYLLKKLHENGIELKKVVDMRIVNLVFTTHLNMELNLDELAMFLTNVEYDPEMFPGVIYRSHKHGAVILVFSNGKLVIVGTIRRDVAESLLEQFENEMKEMMASI